MKDISRILFQLTGIVFVGVVQDREQDEYLISYLFGYTIFFFFLQSCKLGLYFYKRSRMKVEQVLWILFSSVCHFFAKQH